MKIGIAAVATVSMLGIVVACEDPDRAKKVKLSVVAGDGTHTIAKNNSLRPGISIRAQVPGKTCSWAVYSKTGGKIMSGDAKKAKKGLTISSKAGRFKTENCGKWTKF